MKRLVVSSILMISLGLLLLLPSSELWSLITTGSTTSISSIAFSAASGADQTTVVESLMGFGLIAVGAVLEAFSLFTGVEATVLSSPVQPPAKQEEKA